MNNSPERKEEILKCTHLEKCWCHQLDGNVWMWGLSKTHSPFLIPLIPFLNIPLCLNISPLIPHSCNSPHSPHFQCHSPHSPHFQCHSSHSPHFQCHSPHSPKFQCHSPHFQCNSPHFQCHSPHSPEHSLEPTAKIKNKRLKFVCKWQE